MVRAERALYFVRAILKRFRIPAPILFCKACESTFPVQPVFSRLQRYAFTRTVFIAEITARAFIIADSNKRRTLSRADIAKALSKSDQFDFLIDVVPREDPPGAMAQGVGAAGRTQKKGPGTLSAVSSYINTVHVDHIPLRVP